MIDLGCFDARVSDAACNAYCQELERVTRLSLAEVKPGGDKLSIHRRAPASSDEMSVAQVQQGLQKIGFFPGARVDGICGYRTQSAIRLFQEIVRTGEGQACLPDGRFGPVSQGHLQRWLDQGRVPPWTPTIAKWQAGSGDIGEYSAWLDLLAAVRDHHRAQPGRAQQMVEAFAGKSDTLRLAQWDAGSGAGRTAVHLIGIRREEASGKFDDVFVLLVKGLVFKFQGTTEPGATKDPRGLPFIVPGQHDYHFGWHQRRYLALRPQGAGVLVARSANDKRLDEADIARGLEPNATINIHWGGKGMTRDVGGWSEGCQVINGTVYLNPADELVDCSAFTATNQAELDANPGKTRGAYNVLVDLVTALASDLPSQTVKYTLLSEADLALAPALATGLAAARSKAMRVAG
jgi:hypothetical protein